MSITHLLQQLGDPIDDAEEESFILFTSPIPSSNLGFVNSGAEDLELSINGQDVVIKQSPGLLKSNLPGGTTGAVVWKVTPAFATWISDARNALLETGTLSSSSLVLELGAGVSGLVALALGPQVRKYIATDQTYVLKTLRSNIMSNLKLKPHKANPSLSSVDVLALDWEESNIDELPSLVPELQRTSSHAGGFDAIIACDCIYNEALVPSFVNACAELCNLRAADSAAGGSVLSPTVCIIAQQLRSNLVFEEWLRVFLEKFQVWRMPDELLSADLQEGSGFVVHIGILREPSG